MIYRADEVFIQLLSLEYNEVNNNSPIRISTVNNASEDIVINEEGEITFNREGIYFFQWWTNIYDSNVVVSILRKSDMEVMSSSNAPSTFNSIKGNVVLRVDEGETLIFVNDSGGKKILDPIRSGVSMNLCIYRIEGA